jgi:hypothetical protein
MSVIELAPPFTPTAKQTEFFAARVDREAKEVLNDGAIRSGKTQAACRAGPSPKPEQPIDDRANYAAYDPNEARRERAAELEQRQPREEPLWV